MFLSTPAGGAGLNRDRCHSDQLATI